jgi:DNA-binding winged helix-turn-helix (wHTH) protein
MTSGCFRFDRFYLDTRDRRLRRDDVPVELNARYLDALVLLVSEPGRLVPKDRFLDEVWRGVPVTDEALTQCIKTLRKQLGDDAGRPRFIETVPKHGYRFIAPVEHEGTMAAKSHTASSHDWGQLLLLGGAGTLGGGVAGTIGGLFYGFAAASQPIAPGMGAVSVLLVILWLTIVMALIGAAGVSFGIAATRAATRRPSLWDLIGGALGGLVVGAVVKLLGLDAFNLLFGQSPGDITGALEGVLLGGAVGLGAWLASSGEQMHSLRRSVAIAALPGAVVGIFIPLLGGRLMAGSLDLLVRQFPNSRLRLDQIGALLGEHGFGPTSQVVTGALEGALFSGCIVGAMILAERSLARNG